MRINNDCYHQVIYDKTSSKSKEKFTVDSFSAIKKITEKESSNNSSVWEELGNKFDIRNASFEELCDISMTLYKAGQISLLEHGILTFDPSKSPQPVKPNLCLTPANEDGRRNWIAEYEERINQDLKIGNIVGLNNNKKILEILKHLV